MTTRQQQIREFVDEPFSESDKLPAVVCQARRGLLQKDWDDKTAAFHTCKRVLRYAPAAFSDDDVHELVTVVLESLGSSQTALVISAIGALEEAFQTKAAAMEFELPRILPIVLKLHQKTAAFFEAALGHCCSVMVESMSVKRFLTVLVSSEFTKSTRVQTAVSKYCRDALLKQVRTGERLWGKGASEIGELIKMLARLHNGAAPETREAARESSRLLANVYGEQFAGIVQRTLEAREAADFMHSN
jgi:hypothetical protein